MKTKIIEGKECQQRDVVYSDFGATTETEKLVVTMKSSTEYKSDESRADLFKDRTYSWMSDNNPYDYSSDNEDKLDKSFSDLTDEELDNLYSDEDASTEEKDTEYAAGMLNTRLVTLRRPLHIQLKDLYREHTRFYRSKAKSLKPKDMDFLIEDFRYELHRVIAKAKDIVIRDGGNMDTILKVSSLGGGSDLQQTLRKLTILFKRVEQAYEKFGFIPRTYQTKMNDSLSILISHFILDVYGPELEKRKLESSELSNTIIR
jgi:hypothetical protein